MKAKYAPITLELTERESALWPQDTQEAREARRHVLLLIQSKAKHFEVAVRVVDAGGRVVEEYSPWGGYSARRA